MTKIKDLIPCFFVFACTLLAVVPASSQKRMAIYSEGCIKEHHLLSKIDSIRFVNSPQAGFWLYKTDSLLFYPHSQTDSLVFFEWSASECLRRFEVPTINIQVQDNAPVLSKDKEDYLPCVVEIDGKEMYADYIGTARIRGRGNSTWLWYDKKPYRIKLDAKDKILGLGSNKDWVLLANYRDPTNLMNAFGFEMASWLGLPFTNHSRFVEVTLNGDYIGLYQLTEQVEQAGDRVDIDVSEGVLLSLDKDDGPELAPGAEDNFWSAYYHLPICVKHPDDPTEEIIDQIKADFQELELLVNQGKYRDLSQSFDLASLIDFLIVQEMVYNVEMEAPRSVYMYKDIDNVYRMGPVWDFDAGFDFDWGTMTTGHNYFMAQDLVLGTDPFRHTQARNLSPFFTQMFDNTLFVQQFKQRWAEIQPECLDYCLGMMDDYYAHTAEAMARDFERWPIDKNYAEEIVRMKNWLTDRLDVLTEVIENYPAGNIQEDTSESLFQELSGLLAEIASWLNDTDFDGKAALQSSYQDVLSRQLSEQSSIDELHEALGLLESALTDYLAGNIEENLALTASLSTSHCSGWESLEAVRDGLVPENSSAKTYPRYGNWDGRQGVLHWVQYEWEQPCTVSEIGVYWWTDFSGLLQPDVAYIEYWSAGSWIKLGDIGTEMDAFNVLDKLNITTSKIRLSMSSKIATGISEFYVKGYRPKD
jgi:hypothetical protein